MPDVTENVVVTLTLKDEVSATSAKATAAMAAYGNAAKVAAEKANAVAKASAAVSSAADARLVAQAAVRAAGRGGSPEDVAAAQASLAAARESEAQAHEAQAAAQAALRDARAAETEARSAVTAAERESAQATAALAKQDAAAAASAERVAAEASVATRERQNEVATIDRLSARMAELETQRAGADGEARAGLDREIAGLGRLIAGHQDEILKLDQKRVALEETAKVAVATSEAEVAQIRAVADARLVELRATRDEQLAAAEGARPSEVTATAGLGLGGSFAGIIAGQVAFQALSSGVSDAVGKLREALDLARQSAEVQDHLRASLGDSAGQYDQIATSAADTAAQTRFSADQLAAAADQLANRGAPVSDIARAMKVAADTATALHKPIEDVADQIATTFGGTVPRDLKHAVAGLQELSPAALESGAALDELEKRFGGRALADALTPSGREAKSAKDLSEAWKNVGKQILPIVQEYLPKLLDLTTSAVQRMTPLLSNGGAGAVASFANSQIGIARSVIGAVLPSKFAAPFDAVLSAQQASFTAQAQAPVNAAKAKQQVDDYKAAEQEIDQIHHDGAIQRDGDQADGSAKRLDAVSKEVGEEFKLRTAGFRQYLDAINAAAASERDPLDHILADLNDRRASASGDAKAQGHIADAAMGRGDQPAATTAAKREATDLELVRDLDAQIAAIDEKIADAKQRQNDATTRAIQEAGQLAERDAATAGERLTGTLTTIGKSGDLNPLDAYGQGAAAATAYRTAVASAEQQLDGLIALAKDPATKAALADLKLKVEVDAQKTLDEVHTLAGDIHTALEEPLAGAFDKMIMSQGTLAQRLRAGAQSFIESVTKMLADMAAKMAANAVLTGLLGGTPGQGGGGGPGLIGGIGQMLFGGAAKAATTAAVTPAAGSAAPAAAGTAASGGLIGGVFNGIGKALFGSSADPAKAPADQVAKAAAAGTGSQAAGSPTPAASPAAGGLIGGLFNGIGQALFGPAAKPSPSVAAATPATPAAPASSPATPGLVGLIGGGLSSLGGAASSALLGTAATKATINAAGQAVPGAAAAPGLLADASGAVGNAVQGVGSAASGIGSTLAGIFGSLFAEGGYTGDGPVNAPAGIIHHGEYVLHARAVQRYGIDSLDRMNAGDVHPDALAGIAATDRRLAGVGVPSTSAVALRFGTGGPQLGGQSPAGTSDGVPDGTHTITPAIIMNEAVAAAMAGSPALQRQLAKQQLSNPGTWAPVHKAFGGR
jgi:hypothetical protein